MDYLSRPFTEWGKDLGEPMLTPELKNKIVQGVHDEAAGHSIDDLAMPRLDFARHWAN